MTSGRPGSSPALVYAALAVSAFCWGGSAIAGKVLLEVQSPATVTFSRFAAAALCLFALCAAMRMSGRVSAREHLHLAVLGLVGVALCYYCYFEGLHRSSAINAALAEATIPLVTLALSAVLAHEPTSVRQIAGLVLSYLGVVVIVTNLDWAVIAESRYNVGDLLLLASTVCFGVYNFLLRRWAPSCPPMVRTGFIFGYGSIALLPWLLLTPGAVAEVARTPALSPTHLFAAVFMCVGSSVLAYVLFNRAVEQIGAPKASSFINLVPPITIALAILVLREVPTTAQIVGGLIVLTGLWVANHARPVPKPPPESAPPAVSDALTTGGHQ